MLPAIAGDRGVSLVIYNQIGQAVRTLVNEAQGAGSHDVLWNGLDDQNRHVVSGIYFYRLKYGEYSQTRKMILLR